MSSGRGLRPGSGCGMMNMFLEGDGKGKRMSKYDALNPMQREAVFHREGPLLILAGAGSGKTRALTYRIAYLIEECGVKPWNILAITFTNKAAEEMRERVNGLVELGADSVWVSTFHSMCVRILRRFIENIGYEKDFSIYDSDDSRTLMKQIFKEREVNNKQYRERDILSVISAAKNEMISPEEFLSNARADGDWRGQKIGELYAEYESRLKKNNALDFDDLLVKTVELFSSSREILDYYQERFRYIMVDEYQDTNTVQFKLVSLLAKKYGNICVVGDDDQSIYRFRGADIKNILSFEETFPGARVIRLEQNYRSTKMILDAANQVIRNNAGRKEKTLWTENESGEKLLFRLFDTAYDEAEWIVRDMIKKGGAWKDYAVLYRTNAQSRLFEEKCIAYNVPYRLVGGVNFYQRREIKDILCYLKTIANGRDDLAVQRIINVPKRGIGATTVAKVGLFAADHDISFYDALLQIKSVPGAGRAASKIAAFTAQIDRFRFLMEQETPIEDVIEEILSSTGYREELMEEGEVEANARLENIDELVNKAASYWEEGNSLYGSPRKSIRFEEDGLPWAESGVERGGFSGYGERKGQQGGEPSASYLKRDSYGVGSRMLSETSAAKGGFSGKGAAFKGSFGKTFTVQKAESLSYGPGDRVLHDRFGEGTVKEIRDGGKDYEVTVAFDSVGVRKMFASFAKLKKL